MYVSNEFVDRDRGFPIVRYPIHALLVPVPVVCFTGALITDIVYSRSTDMQWANFSAWLLFVGIVFGVLAAIAGIIDFGGHRRIRRQGPACGAAKATLAPSAATGRMARKAIGRMVIVSCTSG